MIQLNNIHLAFAGIPILDGLSWTIKPNQRIGLIGPNGAGKSTLLKLLAGTYTADAGTIQKSGGIQIGYLAQDVQESNLDRSVLDEAMTAFADVLEWQAKEIRLTEALEAESDHTTAHYEQLLHDLDDVHTHLNASDAHLIRPKSEAVLTGLGFDADELTRPMSSYSGGWRMRVALAKILLSEPDYLLLDEPTNHLDIESIAWFEQYLKSYRGTVVLVSHDRYVLDRMVTHIAELSRGRITDYAGNYAFYLHERTERRELQRAAYENQQKEITETERFIERFRYKASKARQVQSRVKHLEKLERILPPPSEEAEISIRFPTPRRSGRIVMALSRFSKTYVTAEGTVEVFRDADALEIERGDKIALIGKNGAGKSTLARMLRGTEPFDGSRDLGHHVDLTYFAQHQAEELSPSHSVLEALREKSQGHTDTELRTMLGAFLFEGDDVFKPVSVLSGGEKSRLALARTLLHPANFLILDEPTNHLDIQSIGVLVEALRQYTGSFIVVSHDRHFLDQIANRVWYVGEGRVRTFDGTYSEYVWHREHGTAARLQQTQAAAPAVTNGTDETSSTRKTKEQKRREAAARKQRYEAAQEKGAYHLLNPYQLRKVYEETEATILKKEARQTELEAALADPDLYDEDGVRAREATAAYEAVQQELAALYEKWEALAEQLAEQE